MVADLLEELLSKTWIKTSNRVKLRSEFAFIFYNIKLSSVHKPRDGKAGLFIPPPLI
jgi:hypothetical protein